MLIGESQLVDCFGRILQHCTDQIDHIPGRSDDLIVGESQDGPSVVDEPPIAEIILLDDGVAVSICLDHQTALSTRKVGNEWTDRILATKPDTKPAATQLSPQHPLRPCRVLPVLAGESHKSSVICHAPQLPNPETRINTSAEQPRPPISGRQETSTSEDHGVREPAFGNREPASREDKRQAPARIQGYANLLPGNRVLPSGGTRDERQRGSRGGLRACEPGTREPPQDQPRNARRLALPPGSKTRPSPRKGRCRGCQPRSLVSMSS